MKSAVIEVPTGSVDGKKDDNSPLPVADATQAMFCCFSIRMFSLFCLVFQNCTAVLLMRYTMTRVGAESSRHYSVSSVIVMTEVVKLVVCFVAIVVTYYRSSGPSARHSSLRAAFAEIVSNDFWKLSVPAGLYTLQNNLLFVALANLEATLFQVLYQSKVLATALLMVLLLKRTLTWVKWGSLFILFLGIVLTQLKGSNVSRDTSHQHALKGLAAVLTCAMSSAFASVYFEKVLKTASASIAVKNIQLSFFSILFAMIVYWYHEEGKLENFLDGYDVAVSYLVFNQAAGGLLVALVIKYADNILKGFATAIAIVLGGVVSYFFLDFSPTFPFACGALLVVTSIGVYGLPDK